MTLERGGPKAVLARHGLGPKPHFGQNFLADENLARRIAELATTPTGGTVVEIGAGLGALTAPLLARAARVLAVERDRDLVPLLADTFAASVAEGRLAIVEADAKRLDYRALLAGTATPRTLAGNLPYQLTGPLLELTTHLSRAVDRVVYMVQLEVANRLAARAASPEYGALSVFVQAAFAVERAFVVRRGAFFPQPGVDSAVIVLTPHVVPVAEETEIFRAVVKGAFSQRRKTLRNAWRGLQGLTQEQVAHAAARAAIDLDARGETLSVAAFAGMAAAVAGATS